MAITAVLPARAVYFSNIVSELTSASTTDDPGGIINYEFIMGDTTTINSSSPTIWHKYSTPATGITIQLTVTNSLLETDIASVVVNVIDPVIDTSKQLRKYITQFMDVFNGLTITNKDGTVLTVPMVYGGQDRVISYIRGDDGADEQRTSIALPLMSARMTGINLRGEDIKASHQVRHALDSNNDIHTMINPTPVLLTFDLGIWTYDYAQAFSMLETIVPWFNPDLIINIGDFDYTSQSPLILETVNDETTLDFGSDQRIIKYDLEFSLKGFLPRNRQINDKVTSVFLNTIIEDAI